MPLESLLAFALVHLMAAASPGPNFFLISGLSGRTSRRAGLLAAVGITLSVIIWSSSAALGLNVFLDRNPVLYAAIQYIGAAYLVWLGLVMLRGALRPATQPAQGDGVQSKTAFSAFRRGFLVNLSNPKTVAYYTSVFAVFVPHGSDGSALAEIVITAAVVSFCWWCAVAFLFSMPVVRNGFLKISRWIDLIAGGAFVLFGFRLATR
jgi:threonine efflux protein